jgi:hypothetical protein
MSSENESDREVSIPRDPRFEHGADLDVIVRRDDSIEFRGDGPEEFIQSDSTIHSDDAI